MDKNYLDALDKYFATLENTGSIDQKTKNMLFMNMSLGKIGENVNLTEEQKEIVKNYFNCMKHNSCFSNSLKDSCCQTSRCSDSQVQADWTEENPYSDSYIQHKPEIPEHFQGKNVLANSPISPENSVDPTDNDTTYLNHVENEEVTDGGSLKIQGDGGVSVSAENGTLTIFAEDVDVDLLIPITYNDLKTLRNNNGLKPGCRYRIIDYVTKANIDLDEFDPADVYPEDLPYLSFSANHPFDIVVLATSTNKLSETARAIKHDGDTYFAKSNLEAWELKYSLDNDLRYEWIIDPFNEGIRFDGPVAYNEIDDKSYDQNPPITHVTTIQSVNDMTPEPVVPQWLYDQLDEMGQYEQSINPGVVINYSIVENYKVDNANYGFIKIADFWSYTQNERVIYFNRAAVVREEKSFGGDSQVYEYIVVYDNENPNVWTVETEDPEQSFDLGISPLIKQWWVLVKDWREVKIGEPKKINLPVHDCKGVVFYMKDEFNNEANYDFKNIVYCYGHESFPIKYKTKDTYIIPNDMSNPTQVSEYGNDVEYVYDNNTGYYVPYHNGEQCLVAYNDEQTNPNMIVLRYVDIQYNSENDYGKINYAGTSSLVGNTNYTTIFSYQGDPGKIRIKADPINPSEYELGLYLGYTFSKGYEEFNAKNKTHEKKSLTGKETKEELKEILKNRTHTFKDYKSDKKKTITSSALQELSAKNIKKDEPKKRTLSERKSRILQLAEKYKKDNIENIFGFKQNTKTSDAKNNTKSDNGSTFWLTLDASLNDFDYELYDKYMPSVIGENKVHGYVVNYNKNYDPANPDTSVFGCYTLPMALFLLDYDYGDVAMTFNKIYLDGYDGVIVFDTLWFEGNKLDFPYNKAGLYYVYAYSFGAMYNFGDYYTDYIIGSPDSMDDDHDEEWHQGDYRFLKNKPNIPEDNTLYITLYGDNDSLDVDYQTLSDAIVNGKIIILYDERNDRYMSCVYEDDTSNGINIRTVIDQYDYKKDGKIQLCDVIVLNWPYNDSLNVRRSKFQLRDNSLGGEICNNQVVKSNEIPNLISGQLLIQYDFYYAYDTGKMYFATSNSTLLEITTTPYV